MSWLAQPRWGDRLHGIDRPPYSSPVTAQGALVTNRSSLAYACVGFLAAAHVLFVLPVSAALSERGQSQAPPPVGQPATETPRPPNRTVPNVTSPANVFTLPETPTDAELSNAHVFSEPLIPMPRGTTAAENRSLARALRLYAEARRSEQVAPLLQFVSQFPQTAWKASLLANLGTVYRSTGLIARLQRVGAGLDRVEKETEPRPRGRRLAIGEWFELSHKLGRPAKVVERLQEVEGRNIAGRAGQKIALARGVCGSRACITTCSRPCRSRRKHPRV